MYLLIAVACSLAMIAWLWHSDAKRRRVAGAAPAGIGQDKRRFMAIAAVVPGAALAATGDSASFLIWLGSCVMGGWLIAQLRS